MKELLKRPQIELKKVFKNEDTRFMLFTGLKVAGISLCINLFVYGCLFQVMRLNYAFFRAHGFPDFQDETVFYNYLLGEAMESFTTLFAFHIFLFFIGGIDYLLLCISVFARFILKSAYPLSI